MNGFLISRYWPVGTDHQQEDCTHQHTLDEFESAARDRYYS
jgi:hypothetical protein